MRIKYYPETDTLYIEFKETPSIESEEIAEGIIVDYDENNEIIGLEILDWSKRKDLELPLIGKFQLTST